MSSPDDGHGPSYGCGWNNCGNPDAELPCPFVKDDTTPSRGLPELVQAMRRHDLEAKAEMFDELQNLLKRILDHD